MKKIITLAAATLLLAGCTATPATPKAETYAIPADCNVKQLVKLDPSYEVIDQTPEDAKDSRECAIGVPESDLGIFFAYSLSTDAQWAEETDKLKADGYTKWASGLAGVDAWRLQLGDEEEGASCAISAHISNLAVLVSEPGTTCTDELDKGLLGYVIAHAVSK